MNYSFIGGEGHPLASELDRAGARSGPDPHNVTIQPEPRRKF